MTENKGKQNHIMWLTWGSHHLEFQDLRARRFTKPTALPEGKLRRTLHSKAFYTTPLGRRGPVQHGHRKAQTSTERRHSRARLSRASTYSSSLRLLRRATLLDTRAFITLADDLHQSPLRLSVLQLLHVKVSRGEFEKPVTQYVRSSIQTLVMR